MTPGKQRAARWAIGALMIASAAIGAAWLAELYTCGPCFIARYLAIPGFAAYLVGITLYFAFRKKLGNR